MRFSDWSDYCLAHLFVDRTFDSGLLGLANIASPSFSQTGGVCSTSKSLCVRGCVWKGCVCVEGAVRGCVWRWLCVEGGVWRGAVRGCVWRWLCVSVCVEGGVWRGAVCACVSVCV